MNKTCSRRAMTCAIKLHHLKEWLEKDIKLKKAFLSFSKQKNMSEAFIIIRDLAEGSKHFKLDNIDRRTVNRTKKPYYAAFQSNAFQPSVFQTYGDGGLIVKLNNESEVEFKEIAHNVMSFYHCFFSQK